MLEVFFSAAALKKLLEVVFYFLRCVCKKNLREE